MLLVHALAESAGYRGLEVHKWIAFLVRKLGRRRRTVERRNAPARRTIYIEIVQSAVAALGRKTLYRKPTVVAVLDAFALEAKPLTGRRRACFNILRREGPDV